MRSEQECGMGCYEVLNTNPLKGKLEKCPSEEQLRVNQYEAYIGQALSGEYVLLKEGVENEDDIFYGQVYLGKFIQGKGIFK